ncbi:MAG: hypothetical protein N2C12_14990 [Planctomycetales bacterium]
MMTSYAEERDVEMRRKSNRTYQRIVAALDPTVMKQYGYEESKIDTNRQLIQAAVDGDNWQLVAQLASNLSKHGHHAD